MSIEKTSMVKNTEIVNSQKAERKPLLQNKADILEITAKTGTAAAGGLASGKFLGNKLTNYIEKQVVEFTHDFANDGGKRFGFKVPVEHFSKLVKSSIKWGVGALGAVTSVLLVFKDSDKDGKNDLLEAINTFINPEIAD